jgi:hypothetical protein
MLFFKTLPKLNKNGSISNVRLFQIFHSPYDREPMLKMWIKELQNELDRVVFINSEKKLKANLAKIEVPHAKPEVVKKAFKRTRENCKQVRLLKYLQENSMIRADKAEELFGIVNVSAIVYKLRERGHDITVMHRNAEAGITRAIYVLKDKK